MPEDSGRRTRRTTPEEIYMRGKREKNRRIATDIPITDERAVALRLKNRGKCEGCDEHADDLQIHEIIPKEYAANRLSNYILLCEECHEEASAEHCLVENDGVKDK